MIKTMNKPLTYDDIPKMYLFCNHTKCPRRNKCLRFQAAMIVPQSVPHYEAININHVAGNEKECSYFSAYTLTTFALGISHILDDVPHKKAMAIQNSLKSLMGKSMYYRIRNKQRRLHPSEQKQIATTNRRYLVMDKTEYNKYVVMINFDEYIEDYDW